MKTGSTAPSFAPTLFRCLLRSGAVLISVSLLAAPAKAVTCPASDTASLAACITNPSTTTITLTQNITLTAELPAVQSNIIINGQSPGGGIFTLNGAGEFRGFFVANFAGGSTPNPVSVTIENIAIQNTLAKGGNGGGGGVGQDVVLNNGVVQSVTNFMASGGGGGAGLGGAIFVANGANVTVSNVSLSSNSAQGGNGGAGDGRNVTAGPGSGGGGGLGGNGATGGDSIGSGAGGGGGGGVGLGAHGGSGGVGGGGGSGGSGIVGGASGGGSGGAGGANGGGGGGGATGAGAGGGVGGQGNASGGNGGFGGGGGGLNGGNGAGGFFAGGFGGGGGGSGGNGGFGGGGGGRGLGGFGGGDGGPGGADGSGQGGGGGGLGAGGAIFVQGGGSLTVSGNLTVNGNTVAGGIGGNPTGGGPANNGSAFGSGIFLQGAPLTFNPGAGNTQTISDVIADPVTFSPAKVALTGSGTLVLSGANTYSGGTFVSGGTLVFGNNSALGSGVLSLGAGTTLSFGAGNFTVPNQITISGDPTFMVAPGATQTISNTIGDGATPGDIVLTGGGKLVLTAANSYSGSTTISAGTLSLSGAGSIANSSLVNLANPGVVFDISQTTAGASITTLAGVAGSQVTTGSQTLTLSNASTNFAGSIQGTGGLTLNGGLQTLSGVNTYSGATTINAGVLEVDGSIATSSVTTVTSGSALTGTGTVGTTQINAGGMLAPGNAANPAATLAVSGNLALASGALYLVQVSGTSASNTAVTGTAALAGNNVTVDVLTRLTQKTTYTILTSSGLNNTTFGSVNLLIANNFARNPVLTYAGGDVFLTLNPGLLSPLLPGNANANQTKVAGAIDAGILAGGLGNAFGAIFNLSGAGLLNGLTQLSGETATGSQQTTFDAMGQFMGLLTDPFMNRTGGAVLPGAAGYADEALGDAARRKTDAFAMFTKAPPAFEQHWSVWAAGYGGSQSTDGSTAVGSNNTTSNIAATAVGADYLISPTTIAGFALAGGGTSFSVANGGTGRSDLFQAGAYLRHVNGPAYISAALAYGWQDITTDRTVTVAGFDQLRAEFHANAYSGRLEGGYRFVFPATFGIGVTPYAAAQFVTFDLPAYAEQAIVGTNNFALGYNAKDVTDARTELGIRTDKSWALADGILTLRGRFAWAHDYDPDRSIAATFQSLPGASFVVNGAAQAADSALTTASIEMKWKNGWSAAATFEGEFSNVTRSYAGKGVVRYAW